MIHNMTEKRSIVDFDTLQAATAGDPARLRQAAGALKRMGDVLEAEAADLDAGTKAGAGSTPRAPKRRPARRTTTSRQTTTKPTGDGRDVLGRRTDVDEPDDNAAGKTAERPKYDVFGRRADL